jgi:hypothetical protein
MGVQTVEQIDSLDKNPPGVYQARLMEIIGQAMLSAGIMIGAALAAKGRVQEEVTSPGKAAGKIDVEPTEPLAKNRVIPEEQAEKGAPAEVLTGEGDHKVVITKLGDIFRCSPLCVWLRELYRNLIEKNSVLRDEMWHVERRAKEAAGKNDGGAMAREVAQEIAKLEQDLKNASFIDLQARYHLSDEQVAQVRRTGVDAPIYAGLLERNMPMDQALGIASTSGPRGVLEAERTLASGGTIDDAMKSAARTWRPGEAPTFARASAEKRVRFKDADPRSAYAQARDDAVANSALGNDTVPFVQDLGPNKGLVTGQMSRDGTRGWRIDFDPGTRGKPGKGLHVNWWRLEDGVWYKGSNEVVGAKPISDPATMKMFHDLYLDTLSHFPGQTRPPATTVPLESGGISQSFPNQLPERLPGELAEAQRLRVKPMKPSDPGFESVANSGSVKWVVTEQGELLVIPKYVEGVEISHTVLTNGQSVLAAGEAEISIAGKQGVGIDINYHSGHYKPTPESVAIGKEAFAKYGIVFP